MTPEKLSYSVAEAVAATGLSKAELERAIKAGDLEVRTRSPKKKDAAHGGKRVILADELKRFLLSLDVVA